MVQTSTGAKSNPWITYMKACRENYNTAKSTGAPVSPEPPFVKAEETTESQIKKVPKTRKKPMK